MSNNRQSSIEWLDDKLASLNFDYLTGQIDNKKYNERHKEIIEQAKAMHENEVVDFGTAFFEEQTGLTPEQYYNETFGGNK